MWGTAGTPKDTIGRLNQALAQILVRPELQERLRADGVEPAHSTPEEFARLLDREIATWKKVVKAGNIKVE
jgi:tripartite-type tricarboxylate transporter receptor subunit TctC